MQLKSLTETTIKAQKSFSPQELEKVEMSILQKEGREMEIPGFRKGNAPLWKIKENLLQNNKFSQLLGVALQEEVLSLWEKDFEEEYGPITKILDLKVLKEKPLEIELEIEHFPKIKETDIEKIYGKIKVKKESQAKDLKISKDELRKGLRNLQKKRTILKPIEEKLDENRLAFVKVQKERTDSDSGLLQQDIISWGKSQLGKVFDRETQGMAEGNEKVIEIQEAEINKFGKLKSLVSLVDPNWKSGNLNLKVKVEKVFVSEVPKLDDEFAKSLGKFENLEGLEKSLREGLLLEKLYGEKEKRRDNFIKELLDKIDLEIPKSLTEESAKREIEEFERNYIGPNQEKKPELDKEKINKAFFERAEKTLKFHRIIEAVALKEKIVPEEKEIEEETQKVLALYPSAEEAKQAMGDIETLKARVTISLIHQKSLEFLEKKNGVMDDLEEEIEKVEKEKNY